MTNTIPNVQRDWFDRVHALLYEIAHQQGQLGEEAECLGSFIPGILSAPSPAGVDGLEVVAYRVSLPGEPELGTWLDEDAENEPQMCLHDPLCRLSDAQALIDGLRGEVYDEEKERALFEAAFVALHLSGQYDSWIGRWKFTEYHVDSLWFGWISCAKSRALSAGKEGE